MRALILRLARSAGAGAIATVADLATLTGLVQLATVTPRAASVPALLVGNVVMFAGQKRIAFRATGDVRREAILFTLVQIGGFALTAILYDALLRAVPLADRWYVAARLATTNLVWLAYSFPLWHFVFRARPRDA